MAFRRIQDGTSIPQPNLLPFGGAVQNTGNAVGQQQMNGTLAPQFVPLPGSVPSQPSSNSSYSVLSYQTGQSSNNGFMNVFQNGLTGSPSPPGNGLSLTDISLEKAMEKVQELAAENATLRGKNFQ